MSESGTAVSSGPGEVATSLSRGTNWWGAFVIGLALSSAGLLMLELLAGPHAGRGAELITVVGCNALTTAIRFLLLRAWVFSPSRNALVPVPEQSR